jgi:uncharacterized membrane protein YadS
MQKSKKALTSALVIIVVVGMIATYLLPLLGPTTKRNTVVEPDFQGPTSDPFVNGPTSPPGLK